MTKTKPTMKRSTKNPPAVLSIAIPCYNRPEELSLALQTFADQIEKGFSELVEIVVTDDRSTDDTPKIGRAFAKKYSFIKFKQNKENIGLEKNLIHCTKSCKGEFLWIFGDDDYLGFEDSLQNILDTLSKGKHDFLVLNRSRRSKDLNEVLTENWMKIPTEENKSYSGLREFCLDKGLISVIGFISVNIFKRKPFVSVNPDVYFGTMYPQLGMMLEAFHDAPVLLVGKPHIVHRTATMAEKRAALGNKSSEKDFMTNEKRRNALYFSLPFFRLVQELITKSAFTPEDITRIPENTVIQGLLVDFLINTAGLAIDMDGAFTKEEWSQAREFFNTLPLKANQKARLRSVWPNFRKDNPDYKTQLSFSVITPSYNQAEFLQEGLEISQGQSIKPIEHFVFDPGSSDGSREIAANMPGVTLVAEPDDGQSDAINKGFLRINGDIIAWVNSDDCYIDDLVFERVAERFDETDAPDIVYGKGIFEDEEGRFLRDAYVNPNPETLPWRFQHEDGILQPALFMRRSVIEKVGLLTLHRHHCMDYEYWIRCVKAGMKFAFIDEYLARAKYHSSNKTFGERDKSYLDVCDMMIDQFGYANHIWLKRYAEYLASGYDGVLTNAANQGTTDDAKIEYHYDKLLRAYNTGADTYEMLASKASQKGYGDTLRELKNRNIGPSTPCKTIPLDQDWERGYNSYTVANRRWAFEAEWKSKQIEKAHIELKKCIANRKSDTCIIVGNGPSLNKIDMSLFEGHDVIVSNNVHLSPELMSQATYYTVVNYLVAEQSAQHINRMTGMKKILPYWLAYCLNEGPDTFFMDAVGHAKFSTDMFKNMSWRHTVTFFNMHLAYGLGYRKVILTGFDHSYRQKTGIKEGETILSDEPDDNHFNGKYFQGKKWQAADVDMMEEMYKLAKVAFEADGREIINATVGGHLELFPRQELSQALLTPAKPSSGKLSMTSTYTSSEYNRDDNVSLDETDLIFDVLKDSPKKGTMIDVGAHHGSALAPFQGLDWDIYAYEPDPKNRIHLDRKFGDKTNVKIDSRAVSDKLEMGRVFYSSTESAGISGMLAFRDSHEQSATVDVTTVDQILRDEKIDHIEFLKIDVEGYDFNVLKGVPWDRLKPDVIESEFEDAKTVHLGHTWRDICEYLEEKGYTVYVSEWHPIVRYGISHQWRALKRFPCELSDQNAWGNLLAFKTDPGPVVMEKVLNANLKSKPSVQPKLKPAPTSQKPPPQPSVAANDETTPVLEVQNQADSVSALSQEALIAEPPKSIVGNQILDRPFYAKLSDNLRRKRPALFRIAQFGLWGLRFIKRHLFLSAIGVIVLGGLTLGPLLSPTLAPHSHLLWSIAVIISLLGAVLLSAAFINMMVHRMNEREQNARSVMQRDILSSIKSSNYDLIERTTENIQTTTNALESRLNNQITRNVEQKLSSKLEIKNARALELAEQRLQLSTAAQHKNSHRAMLDRANTLTTVVDNIKMQLNEATAQLDAANRRNLKNQKLSQEKFATEITSKITSSESALENIRATIEANSKQNSDSHAIATEQLEARLIEKITATEGLVEVINNKVEAQHKLSSDNAIAANKLEARLTEKISTTEKLVIAAGSKIEAQQELSGNFAVASKDLETRLIEKISVTEQLLRVTESKIEAQTKQSSSQNVATEQLESKLIKKITATEQLVHATEVKVEAQQKQAELDAQAKIKELEALIEAAKAEIAEIKPAGEIGFQNFNRALVNNHTYAIEQHWLKPLNLDLSRRAMGYMAERIRQIETNSLGRLATSIEDALLRILVTLAVPGRTLDVLEIGTLFGIGAAMIHDRTQSEFESVHLTLIDPLEGYYGNDAPDILTNERVTRHNLVNNFNRAMIPAADYTIIEGFSTDDTVIEEASKRSYDVLIIDGDHSYAGVKGDFINFAPFVKRGGFIIVDDYSTEHWPEIAKYVDDELVPRDDITLVGTIWRTAVFRVLKPIKS